MRRPGLALMFAGVSLMVLAGCGASPERKPAARLRDDLLGTVISFTVYDNRGDALIDDMTQAVERVDKLMSIHNPGSELSLAAEKSGVSAVPLSRETQETLSIAMEMATLSGGAFNPAIGPLTRLWGIGTEQAALPSEKEIADALALTSMADILFENGQLTLRQQGMLVDLGGVAKGYACDLAVQALKNADADGALLDLGGNIYAYGKKPDGTPWNIGVRSPLMGDSGIIGLLELQESLAVVTSGGYERYFESDGVTYHHILDPETGCPAESGLLSVTVLCENSAWADALSTACFVLGLEKGQALLEQVRDQKPEIGLKGALFVGDDLVVYQNGELPFHLEDGRFRLAS